MPANKLASFRYRVINNCLKNTGRTWTREDIMEEIESQLTENFGLEKGISRRTFFNDLDIMRSLPPRGFDAPIIVQDGFYRYEDPDFSIDQNPLNETDIETLRETAAILKQFNQIPAFKGLDNILAKIEEGILATDKYNIIHLDSNTDYKNLALVSKLYEAMKETKQILFKYQPFDAEERYYCLHPYFIKEYNNRWFVVCWNDEYGRQTILAVDRINSFELTDKVANYDFKTRLLEHMALIVGMSFPEDMTVKKIYFKVSRKNGNYIVTKPIHTSQILIEKEKEFMVFQLELIPNYDLEMLLKSYDAEILKSI